MSEYEIVGPFESHRVIVSGGRVPLMDAHPVNGGNVALILDGRPQRHARGLPTALPVDD